MKFELGEKICERFALGDPTEKIRPVTGGLIHQMWQLTTSEGRFAVKLLDKKIMARPGAHTQFERCENISSQFCQSGIPSLSSIAIDGQHVQTVTGNNVLVFNWFNGESTPLGSFNTSQAARIGKLVGHMHALNLKASSDIFMPLPMISNNQFSEYLNHLQMRDENLSQKLSTDSERIALWIKQANAAATVLQQNLVVSHGDLDQKNVLWTRSESSELTDDPVFIDWESAGLINPTCELLSLCLDWSGFPVHPPAEDAFLTLLRNYASSNKGATSLDSFEAAFFGVVGNWLKWLLFNLERATDTDFHDTESENAIGVQTKNEIEKVTDLLIMLAEKKEEMKKWFKF